MPVSKTVYSNKLLTKQLMSNLEHIPHENRTKRLKPLIFEYLEYKKSAIYTKEAQQFKYGHSFYSLIFQYELDEDKTTRQHSLEFQSFLNNNSVPYLQWREELKKILKDDDHLQKCCPDTSHLAMTIDMLSTYQVGANSTDSVNYEKEKIDQFIEMLYSGSFEAIAYSHIFNFETTVEDIEFGDSTIEKIDIYRIPIITGEYSLFSSIHLSGTGNYFVVHKTSDVLSSDYDFLLQSHNKASDLIRVFQYYQDGVVHINYSTLRFSPAWVNDIRKFGFSYIGDLRRLAHDNGLSFYSIDQSDYDQLISWWILSQLPEIKLKLDTRNNNLGEVLERAGEFYESSFTNESLHRRLIDLMIALEALYSPTDQNELNTQISQFASLLIGNNPIDRIEINRKLKKLYGVRSKLMHGSIGSDDESLQKADISFLSNVVRESILYFLSLYLQDIKNRDDVHTSLRKGIFDPDSLNEFRRNADFHILLDNLSKASHLRSS